MNMQITNGDMSIIKNVQCAIERDKRKIVITEGNLEAYIIGSQ